MKEELNILDYFNVIKKWRKFVIAFTCSLVVLTVAFCLVVPWKYRAETTIMVPQRAAKGMEGMLALSSMLTGSTINLPTDMSETLIGRSNFFPDILKSRSVAMIMIDGMHLMSRYPGKSTDDLIALVRGKLKVKEIKGILYIYAFDRDPRFAADLANYAVMALDEFNRQNNYLFSNRTKNFVMEQIATAKVSLGDAEENLKKFETQSQMVKISERELMLERLMREVKVKEAVYTMLMQEYEKTKIDEAKQELNFEVLDSARPPKSPFFPKPLLYAGMSLVLGIFFGVIISFIFEYLESLGIKIPEPDYGKEIIWPISGHWTTRTR
jgi:uncharacterized protein involved in exopolysaccharide biosynthesis